MCAGLIPSQELMDALMETLGLSEKRIELWALNGDPFREGDDTDGGGQMKQNEIGGLNVQFERVRLVFV